MAYSVVSVYILTMPSHHDRIYDYYIPSLTETPPTRGSIVTVPFGGGNRHVSALVDSVWEKEEIDRLKPIVSVSNITLNEEEIGLCIFLKEYTFCSIGDAVRTVIPHSFLAKTTQVYCITNKEIVKEDLNFKALIVYSYIREKKNPTLAMLKREYGPEVTEMLEALIKLGYIKVQTDLSSSSNIKRISYYNLSFAPHLLEQKLEKAKLRSENQRKIMEYLAEHGRTSEQVLRDELSVVPRQLKALLERGLVTQKQEECYRNPYRSVDSAESLPPLTQCQQKALGEISLHLHTGKPEAVLLHGITGSGKTRVIKETIDQVIAQGKQVILLVPEIALTPQTVTAFCGHYHDRVTVLHSSLSAGEKHDAWRRIQNGEIDLCIGTRSAIFAPFSRLGLIVVDEEHEHTYKSEQNPRYHTIDIARYRVSHHKALLLLASATPSLESYYKAKSGAYHLIEMKERVTGAQLPETLITDLRSDVSVGNTSPIGSVLKNALTENLSRCEQSVFFINRRGYHNFLNCPMCGYVVTCPHCSVSLTHHIKNRQGNLVCHYCGYTQNVPAKCPECGTDAFAFVGFGTQFAEEMLEQEYPDSRVMRMDADTTAQKFSYDSMLSDFRAGKADILLGTQMVTKGHDFPNVTLVGVLLADTTLYLNDFRANERTFQLVTQVIGRAGRSTKHGKAIIQTYNPEHPSLLLAATQDYSAFYEDEIAIRKALVFPPFCDMALLGVASKDETFLQKTVIEIEKKLSHYLQNEFNDVKLVVFGPFEAPIYKVKETYRMRFVIKCKSNKRTRALFKTLLNETMVKFGKQVTVAFDINPNSL